MKQGNFKYIVAPKPIGSSGDQIVSLPPYAEQHYVVTKVDELMAFCDNPKACVNQAKALQQHLANAIEEQAAG